MLIDADALELHSGDPGKTWIDNSFLVYQAPEIFTGGKQEGKSIDVYAWAMIALWVFSGSQCTLGLFASDLTVSSIDPPYHQFPPIERATQAAGGSTPQIANHSCKAFEECRNLWDTLERCWSKVPSGRPTVDTLICLFEEL